MYYNHLAIDNIKPLQPQQCCKAPLPNMTSLIYKEQRESISTLAAYIWFFKKKIHSSYIDMIFLQNVSSEEVFKCILRLLFS